MSNPSKLVMNNLVHAYYFKSLCEEERSHVGLNLCPWRVGEKYLPGNAW